MNEDDKRFIEHALKHFFVYFLTLDYETEKEAEDMKLSDWSLHALIKFIGRDKVHDWFEHTLDKDLPELNKKVKDNDDFFGIAKKLFDYQLLRAGMEDKMLDFIDDFADMWWDWYDSSLELDGVEVDSRLNEEGQKFIKDCGFHQVWLTHADGMETYYSLSGELPHPGVRKLSHRHEKKGEENERRR